MVPSSSTLPSCSTAIGAPEPTSGILLPIPLRCKTSRDADQLHARLLITGRLRHSSFASRAVLSLCASPDASLHCLARRILLSPDFPYPYPEDDPFLWNALIRASSHGKAPRDALSTLALMLSHGAVPDRYSFSLALKACSRVGARDEGTQIHGLLVKAGLSKDLFLQNCMVRHYCGCGFVEVARQLFHRMPRKDSVSWNTMIGGYVKVGDMAHAKELFEEMGEEDRTLVTWNSMLSGYAHMGTVDSVSTAEELFATMTDKDLISWNSLIDGYVKCGRMVDAQALFDKMPVRDVIARANLIFGYMEIGKVSAARCLFDKMPVKDVITWNAILSGYVKNACYEDVLPLFYEMQASGLAPDEVTLATVLSAISELACLRSGTFLYDYIRRKGLSLDGKLGVALIDMFAKCGRLDKAFKVFEISRMRTVDHWNAMIGGLAIHGLGQLALRFFSEMVRHAIRPDDITFIVLLHACSHSGLVEEGLACFEAMKKHYSLKPKVQHYGCMVDILGRGGRLEEARRMVEGMPMKPNDVIYRALLNSCRNEGNIQIGLHTTNELIKMSPFNSSSYVLLTNLYAGIGLWNDATKVRLKMKEQGIKKLPGCSWIELDGTTHEFVAGTACQSRAEGSCSLPANSLKHVSLDPTCSLVS